MITEQENKYRISAVFIAKIILFIIFGALFYYRDIQQGTLLYQIIIGINSFLVPSIIVSVIRVVIISVYNARHVKGSVRGNFVLGINRLTTMLNVIFLIVGLMVAMGVNPLDFLMSLTFVAMAIAVLFRDYITNMLSGLFVMFSEQLSVGDRIRVGEHEGRIIDVTFAHIEIQNEEDDIVMVPNNLVFNNPIINLSAHRSSLFTVKFELPLPSALAVEQLEEEVRIFLRNHPNLAKNNEINLEIVEIGKDYVRYKVELYATQTSNRLHRQLENELLRHILLFEKERFRSS